MLELKAFRPAPMGLDPRPAIALIAHDHEKVRLVDLAVCYRDILARHRLIATATTGRMLTDMVGLKVECVRSGMAGGDRQVAQAVAGRGVAAVIFLVDPFGSRPHEPGLGPVMKACSLHDITLATNVATAAAVLNALAVAEIQAAAWPSLLEK
ncbi:MAG: methylglyoxal synthase [Chloroflexota bacterium]|jgi:methylglyoxal synthase|nr:methylglyoxal synthase [Chloroflexota bacterium]